MDNLEDFSIISNVSSDQIPKLSLYDRSYGISSGEAYIYNVTNYDWNEIAKMQKNIPSVENSFISHPTSEEVSFPIQTTTEIVRTLDESNMEPKSLNTPVNENLENNSTDLQDRNSLKNETLDSDFSAVESDEYSDDEGDSDSWDSDNSGTNFGKRSRSSKRPKRCEPGEVYVRCSQNIHGKRCYGKVQYCIYCSVKGKNYNGFTNLSKHILNCEASSAVLENVFMKMQADDITSLVKNDKLITLYAEKLYSKHGSDDQCHMMISQKLREIGRLMMGIQKRDSSIDSLSKCLTPQYYQVVCEATREVSGFDEATGKYKTPSLALKIGHALNKCCSIKQGIATEMNDEILEKETQQFQAVMNATWTNEVSRNALRTLKEAKRNCPTIVPLPEDILTLQRYICAEMIAVEQNLLENPTKRNVETILQIMLNVCVSTATPQVVSALTPVEREMSREFLRVEILGKDGRIAPFIFTPFNINKINVLVSTRDAVGVNKENKYLFAHPFEGAETHIRGHDCLREFSKKCGAQQPIALTGANLKNFISASPY
ncbi:hypothetical protein Avbf_07084 [Armadillidium vulgare]|nr:hypothetical protein Avbf_07084 [Armadillidium vulgare]